MSNQETVTQVGIGTHVEVELIDADGQAEPLAFDIVREGAADFAQGRLGANTPLAKALLGHFVGSTVLYAMGDVRRVRITHVRRSAIPATNDAAQRRQAVLDKARAEAERTNAEMFAASFSGKWGDYALPDERPIDPPSV